ncbi:MAG: hypothetical protein HY698_04975 [Deltaproteobacteria bacterium]|nr:hypothetical protein [Deltaproteobacteria bacterium]
MHPNRFLACCTLIVLHGCGSPEDPDVTTLDTVSQPMASVMGGVEAAIDAPWRLEPIGADEGARANIYPSIPIVVSIHDASLQSDPETRTPLGQFCELRVYEYWADGQQHNDPLLDTREGPQEVYEFEWHLVTRIPADSPLIREIERSDKWPYSSDGAANHRLCRRWAGEDCTGILDVGSSAEWHALIEYTPKQYAVGGDPRVTQVARFENGHDVRLGVTAIVAPAGRQCPVHHVLGSNVSFDRLSPSGGVFAISNHLSVHLGETRLPRFDDGWAYGDLHYHSQGTDNEGESAYAYRPTLQAMRAMGLDFLFATEHASDSGQVTDIDEIYLDKRFDIPYVPEFLENMAYDFARKFALGVRSNTNAARDMSFERFAAMHEWLNRPSTGANAEVLRSFRGGNRAPSIFLGGEVDVIPELSEAEKKSGTIRYGNMAPYKWKQACLEVPSILKTLDEWTTANICETPFDLVERASEGGRYLLKDIQGIGDQYFARQHMVYLPTDSARDDAFVSSRTQLFGGANERLKDLLDPTHWNTMIGKGYAFLAHPVDAARGSGMGRLGPDIVPYSDVQLRTAFESPAILGLQLWNEDTRLESTPEHYGFPLSVGSSVTRWGKWLGQSPRNGYRDLHHGLFAWDKMLQWGIRRSQTSSLGLPPGEPRRVFMAGGSDAHGDWNYRREGRLDGLSGVVDTAIGKPRNLVNVGTRARTVQGPDGVTVGAVGQEQVTAALASGHFSVTDGPALRIAIDNNNNGVIDAQDTPMGGFGAVPPGGYLPVIVEWKSTYEFQPVSQIDLYVGVGNDAIDATLVYAPVNHGIHAVETPTGGVDTVSNYKDSSGIVHWRLMDNYMMDPSGLLRIVPRPSDYVRGGSPLWGRRVVRLRVDDFVVGKLREVPGTEVCRPNAYCRKPGFSELCDEVCRPGKPPSYHFDSPTRPDLVYVRAFVRTSTLGPEHCTEKSDSALRGRCVERLAFTNPVWARNALPARPTFSTTVNTRIFGR